MPPVDEGSRTSLRKQVQICGAGIKFTPVHVARWANWCGEEAEMSEDIGGECAVGKEVVLVAVGAAS